MLSCKDFQVFECILYKILVKISVKARLAQYLSKIFPLHSENQVIYAVVPTHCVTRDFWKDVCIIPTSTVVCHIVSSATVILNQIEFVVHVVTTVYGGRHIQDSEMSVFFR